MAKFDKRGNLILTRKDVEKLREALKPSPYSEAFGTIAAGIAAFCVIVATAKLIGL